jgi:hypothetical protein
MTSGVSLYTYRSVDAVQFRKEEDGGVRRYIAIAIKD